MSTSSYFWMPSLYCKCYSLLFLVTACWNKCLSCGFGCFDRGLSVRLRLQIFTSVGGSCQPLSRLVEKFQFRIIEKLWQSRTLTRFHYWSCIVHQAWTAFFYHTYSNQLLTWPGWCSSWHRVDSHRDFPSCQIIDRYLRLWGDHFLRISEKPMDAGYHRMGW